MNARSHPARLAFASLLTFPLAAAMSSAAQCPQWESFSSAGLQGSGKALAVFDDGSGPVLYCAGSFTYAGSVAAVEIVRFDGSTWSALGGGLTQGATSTHANALAVFDDGSGPALYVGGSFTLANGQPAANVARWDGTNWSPLGAGVGGMVLALEVHDDGSGPALYAGGSFVTAGGTPASRIAKWNGTAWSSLGSGLDGLVWALRSHDDGSGRKLFAGGEFTQAGGASTPCVAKWDGAAWSGLAGGLGGQFNPAVHALEVFDAGSGSELYAGGWFSKTLPFGSVSNVARWNGTSWSKLTTGVSGVVTMLSVEDEGAGPRLFVGGNFTTAGGMGANHVARWSGSAWSSLGSGTDAAINDFVVFNPGSGPRIYATGDFITAGGVLAHRVATWDGGGWQPAFQAKGVTGQVAVLAAADVGAGPRLYAGGSFLHAGNAPHAYVASWDGNGWSALAGGLDSTVLALCMFDDGTGPSLCVGGSFLSDGATSLQYVARWDGSAWSALANGLPGAVRALGEFDDGGGRMLYACANAAAGPGGFGNVFRWNGTAWATIPSSVTGAAVSMVDHDDGSGSAIYFGGQFQLTPGGPIHGVVRWDGVSVTAVGSPLNGVVNVLCVHDDGAGSALYAGGDFTMFGAVPAKRVAKWDGVNWSSLGAGIDSTPAARVVSLASFDDGAGPALWVGGHFDSSAGVPMKSIARWKQSAWSSFGAGVYNWPGDEMVSAFAPFRNPWGGVDLFVGGDFTMIDGNPTANLVTWRTCCTGTPRRYCTAKTNSLGCLPAIGFSGTPSATANSGFLVSASNVRNNKSGLVLYSMDGPAAAPFQNGTLCVAPIVRRSTPIHSGGSPTGNDCSGVYQLDFNTFARGLLGGSPAPALSVPGTNVCAQMWGRDPGFPAPNGTTLTDALQFAVCP